MTNDAPTETPTAVFAALLEAYRQARQDCIYMQYGIGSAYPAYQLVEARELRNLHAACDGWLERFAAASEQEGA